MSWKTYSILIDLLKVTIVTFLKIPMNNNVRLKKLNYIGENSDKPTMSSLSIILHQSPINLKSIC